MTECFLRSAGGRCALFSSSLPAFLTRLTSSRPLYRAAVFVLDRWESATTGWPSAISETDIRVLLPCSEELYSSGTVSASGSDNPLWWPADDIGTSAEAGWAGIKAEDDVEELGGGGGGGETEGGAGGAGQGGGGGFANRFEKEERAGKGGKMPKVSTFAWLCRVVWLGGRIQGETYRASGAFSFFPSFFSFRD